MSRRRMTLSGSIAVAQERFTLQELVVAAEELLREHSSAALNGAIEASRVQFYIEREWVDEPIRDEEGEHFRRRHLLQLCSVQVLRGLDMGLDDIGKLVRGVDNEHLKMLCDEPTEVEKKANVMSNWLSMLDQGRRTPARRGRTESIRQPPVERAFAPPPTPSTPPPPPPEPVVTEGPSDQPPDDLPDGPADARRISAPRTHGRPQTLPVSSRDRRTLLSAGDEALLAALDSRTPLQPPSMIHSLEAAVDGEERTGPVTPVVIRPPAAVPAEAVGAAWARYTLSPGVELHVRDGHQPEEGAELKWALARVARILSGED